MRELLQRGAAVRALVRDTARARRVLGEKVVLVTGDFSDNVRLDMAFSGADKALLLAPNTPDQAALEANLIAAALRAGTRHLVAFSGLGADPESPARIARCHAVVERALVASGIPWTILRPNTFMQNFLASASAIASNGLRLPMRQCRVSLVDVQDVATVAATVLTEPGHVGATYDITGPQALAYTEIAEQLSEVAGRPIPYVDVAPAVFTAELLQAGLSEWEAAAVTELYLHVSPSQGGKITDVIARVTGEAPVSFALFAARHADAFRGD